jgi:hypothetical protein
MVSVAISSAMMKKAIINRRIRVSSNAVNDRAAPRQRIFVYWVACLTTGS